MVSKTKLLEIFYDGMNSITLVFNEKGTCIKWPARYKWFGNKNIKFIKQKLDEQRLKYDEREY